ASRDAIEKDFAAYFASGPSEVVGKPVQMYAVGNEIVDISEWSSGPYYGHSVKIYVRDADTWKIRLEYVNSSGVPRSAHHGGSVEQSPKLERQRFPIRAELTAQPIMRGPG